VLAVMNLIHAELFIVSRSWFDVPIHFDMAVAICRQRKSTLDWNGISYKRLSVEREKCVNPDDNAWIGGFMLLLFLLCICSSCYCCQQSKKRSKGRKVHHAVLRLQEEFVLQ